MEDARDVLRAHHANVIYGTVRLIEQDDETFLPWAKDRYACIIFNLHVDHTPREIDRAADAFRALIDLGITHGGSYYLTYHRWARQDQVERCYPAVPRLPGAQTSSRSRRGVSEQLVSALQRDVRLAVTANRSSGRP